MNVLNKITNLGISESIPESAQTKIKLTNSFLVIMLLHVPVYLVLFYFFDLMHVSWGFIFPSILYPIGLYGAMKKNHLLARHSLMLGFISGICFFLYLLGDGIGIEMFFFVVIGLSYLVCPPTDKYFSYVYTALCILLMGLGYIDWNFSLQLPANIKVALRMSLYPVPFVLVFLLMKFFNDNIYKHVNKIESQKEDLEKMNKELEQFTYVSSHDLKEPLNTISSFTDIIQLDYKDKFDDQLNQYFNYILIATTRMGALIDGLMNYGIIGKRGQPTTVDCNQIIDNIKGELSSKIVETGAIINSSNLPKLKANSMDLHILFQNLISNSIKYHQKGVTPNITVSAVEMEKYWKFSIEDNGIGIEEKYNTRIFSIFQRLHTREEYEGTGIGLAHCKKVIDTYGGKIWVESKLYEGSTFHFLFPN